MIEAYLQQEKERQAQGIPALPLSPAQTVELCSLLMDPPEGKGEFLLDLLVNRISPGVDPAAQVKADFLAKVALSEQDCTLITKEEAVRLLGTMVGGYNLPPLLKLLEDDQLSGLAADALSQIILVADLFEDVLALSASNANAKRVVESWANADWFTSKPALPESIEGVVYKVEGEINTDDFSPASEAWSRPDIPLHALSMGQTRFPEGNETIAKFQADGLQVIFVGDVVGTGSSRKSACNSLLWHIGNDIPYIPNKRKGSVILGGQIAPIFYNTAEDSGALPIRCDVSALKTGDKIQINTKAGQLLNEAGEVIGDAPVSAAMSDEVRAGGRVPLIIGKTLTAKARKALGLGEDDIFVKAPVQAEHKGGYTLAQKMVGNACGTKGILPGTTCFPKMTTVGSQDTTGPMTRDEMMELACLGFQADLVMQSFCHTAAYPKPADVITHATLPDFMTSRKGVALRPGDGVIHSWLNRLLLPDTVGTGGDSHTRFPIGISFPAGSGLVAFAAAMGTMPLEMPESVLVKFKGELQEGITLRDAVNAIPYQAIQKGLLTVSKKNKVNVFNGRIVEIQGLPDLSIEQAFELTDASAERSAAACTIDLSEKSVATYLRSNVALMKKMIADGYQSAETLQTRIDAANEWLANPTLMRADKNAEYATVIEIDLNELTEPILACPNDPDDVKLLSDVQGRKVDEVFVGSCMTNIGHFRAASTILEGQGQVDSILWVCPPTRMDELQLRAEGVYSVFGAAGARLEIPGCSLCMGNQARVHDKATVFSTSTRNFDNRLGKDAQVFLGSAELAAVVALLGKLPSKEEYMEIYKNKVESKSDEIYQYLDFSKMDAYQ
ncbi:MAG: bifunctional aconitate hydratase 2/2-methylisocitrate dehydratase [SAR324 cluster bacterium]|uniref:Aconitate hydratase B n=1 Tax=SAR324 cluster bacterium TaxID=2024889 RepID=A0A2A4SRA8_9DELT|nr:MAG: bifunctional aconitate hydratase 2/2-methylisocitrate dehydratase [SAR324 cluster bacterium]